MSVRELPLFPLGMVLFPGGPLRLRIFETRYIDMISRCMRESSGFGVVLIREGSETSEARPFDVGTEATITDFYSLSDGLLGITAIGARRFRVHSVHRQPDRLLVGEVEMLPEQPEVELDARHAAAPAVLKTLLSIVDESYVVDELRYDDAAWVGGRLAELLPVNNEQKQGWLEVDDAIERLDLIMPLLATLRVRS